jgi:hypothetical protein
MLSSYSAYTYLTSILHKCIQSQPLVLMISAQKSHVRMATSALFKMTKLSEGKGSLWKGHPILLLDILLF